MKIIFFLILFLCCFHHQQVFCQVIENQFIHYTPEDGLTDGIVNDIKQDRQGFLWLATHNGLCRFDGHTFKSFQHIPGDTTSLCENPVIRLFIDSKGRLWCFSYNWLYLYHPEGGWFEHFNMYGFGAVKICSEKNNQLIIISIIKGLYKFDIGKKKILKFDEDEIHSIGAYDYIKEENGTEWISQSGKFVRYDPATKEQTTFLGTTVGATLLPEDQLVVGTFDQGILLINKKTRATKQFLPEKNNPYSLVNASITCLYKLNDSIILVGTNNGLSVFNWRTQRFVNIVPEKTNTASLSESNMLIRCIFRDREGILWIGGDHLEKQDFRNFDIRVIPSYGKEHNQKKLFPANNMFLCPDGKFLLGSYYGLNIYDPQTDVLKKIENKQFNAGKNEKYKLIDCIQNDGVGNNWCINWPRFSSFNIKNNKVVNIHEHRFPFGFRLGDMKLDKKGRVLIGTFGKGLIRFDPGDSSYTVFDTSSRSPAKLTNLKIQSICVANDGSTWIGTERGINKIESDDITVKRFNQNKKQYGSISDWTVQDIKEDSRGMIWFSTSEHGIGRINPVTDSVTLLSTGQGLPTCRYQTICIDANNNLWAKSGMGVLRINTLTLQSQLYTEKEGFPIPDDIIDIYYSSSSRKLYILTSYAIFEINTTSTNYRPRIPETLITGITIFGNEKPVPSDGLLSLNYDQNFINIQFAALLFHSNEQIKYAYKMNGIDADWVYCNFKRNASYTNLPPGHYTFNVRSQSPEGLWSTTSTALSIYIKPPFWQTWWFYLLEIATISAIILWIARLYTARKLATQKNEIEKKQAITIERTRIASDMHDELGAGLTSISLLSEVANQKIKQNISANTEIQKIVRSADLLSKNLTEIIWTMNTGNDNLEYFIIYVRAYATEYFDDTSIRFTFNCPDVIQESTMAGELRRNIFLCIKEALNNIVKHAQATEASLTFSIIGHVLITEIEDNGIGLHTNNKNKFGNGLNTMKNRLNKYGSDLIIDAVGGTKLVFKINILS